MEKQSALDALAALAHPIRLDTFRALVVAGQEGLTPGALVEMFDLQYAKLGFHLNELASAGLLTREQVGRHVIYRAAYRRMDALIAYLMKNCCAGAACVARTRSKAARTPKHHDSGASRKAPARASQHGG